MRWSHITPRFAMVVIAWACIYFSFELLLRSVFTFTEANLVVSSAAGWDEAAGSTAAYVSAAMFKTQLPAVVQVPAAAVPVAVPEPAPGGAAAPVQTVTVQTAGPRPNPVSGLAAIPPVLVPAARPVPAPAIAPGSTVRSVGAGISTSTVVGRPAPQKQLPAVAPASAGAAALPALTPKRGGGTSPVRTHKTARPAPVPVTGLQGISPGLPAAGGSVLSFTGDGSVASATVRRGGTIVGAATIVSSTPEKQIPAAVPVPAAPAAAPAPVPATGGGTPAPTTGMAGQPENPVPVLSSLSPDSAAAGGQGFTLTLNGTNFTGGSTVRWNGAARAMTFVNGGRLTAAIHAADIANAGTAAVTVFNPAPGGGTSAVLTFVINSAAGAAVSTTTGSGNTAPAGGQ